MTFALALILLFIAAPFVLLLLDLAKSREAGPQPQTELRPASRRGVIAPGEGMVHRDRR